VNHGKSRSSWFPGEGHDGVLHVQHFDRNARFVDSEELDIVVEGLLRFGVTRDLDGKIVTVVLPDHRTVGNVEQILLSEFLSAGKLNEIDVGGRVLLLGTLSKRRIIERGKC